MIHGPIIRNKNIAKFVSESRISYKVGMFFFRIMVIFVIVEFILLLLYVVAGVLRIDTCNEFIFLKVLAVLRLLLFRMMFGCSEYLYTRCL